MAAENPGGGFDGCVYWGGFEFEFELEFAFAFAFVFELELLL
jgi:hypothetical protein